MKKAGVNSYDLKSANRRLVLKLLCTSEPLARMDLTKLTGLSAVTSGNIVSDFIDEGLVCEIETPAYEKPAGNSGRKPIYLDISPQSPLICAVYIFRTELRMALADYKARIHHSLRTPLDDTYDQARLVEKLFAMYDELAAATRRRILAVGISSIGPVDIEQGMILKPMYFYGVENLPIRELFAEKTGLPTFLLNDPSAAALAERIYGKAKVISDFIFVSLQSGIGSGIVLGGQLYQGNGGVVGELGHTSIDFNGPRCECGKSGCLEQYTNEQRMMERARALRALSAGSLLNSVEDPTWADIISFAAQGDGAAISVLSEYCNYLAVALSNVLSLFDFSTVFLSYNNRSQDAVVERILEYSVNQLSNSFVKRKVKVLTSAFKSDAVLVGGIAMVMDKIFSGAIPTS